MTQESFNIDGLSPLSGYRRYLSCGSADGGLAHQRPQISCQHLARCINLIRALYNTVYKLLIGPHIHKANHQDLMCAAQQTSRTSMFVIADLCLVASLGTNELGFPLRFLTSSHKIEKYKNITRRRSNTRITKMESESILMSTVIAEGLVEP